MSVPSEQDFFDAAFAVSRKDDLFSLYSQSSGSSVSPLAVLSSTDLLDLERPSDGFYAQTYQDSSGNILVSFAPSDLNMSDTDPFAVGSRSADLQVLQGKSPQALADAVAYAAEVVKDYGAAHKVYVTGYSLGGIEAEAVASTLGSQIIAGGRTYGATGLPNSYTNFHASNFIDYVDYGDPVGNYARDGEEALISAVGNHFGQVQKVGSTSGESAIFAGVASVIAAGLFGGDAYAAEAKFLNTALPRYHPLSNYANDLISAGIISVDPTTLDLNVSQAAPKIITSAADLESINADLSGNYILGNDIDASPTAGWNGGAGFIPIGSAAHPFTGTLNGNGHTIANLVIDESTKSDGVGLFGSTGSTALIENLGLVDESVAGGSHVGGLAGSNSGTIQDSFVDGSIAGRTDVGGLAGSSSGTVSQSYSVGKVDGSGVANGLGGLLGVNSGSVTQSYAAAVVSSSAYPFPKAVGGLIGVNTGTVTNSYWDAQASGQAKSAGGVALTTAQLQSGNLPSGLDPSAWNDVAGSYPSLDWQANQSVAGPAESPAVLSDFGLAQGWGSPDNLRVVTDVNGDGVGDYVGFNKQFTFISYGGDFANAQGLIGPGFSAAVPAVQDFGTNEGYTAQDQRGVAATGAGAGDSIYGQGFAGVYWYGATSATPQTDALGNAYNVLNYQSSPNFYGNFGSLQGWTPDNGFQIVKSTATDPYASILGFGNAGIVVGPQAFAPGATATDSYVIPFAAGNNSGWDQQTDIRTFTDVNGKTIDLNHDGIADFIGMGPQGLAFAFGNDDGPKGSYGLGPLQNAQINGTDDALGDAQGWTDATTLRTIVADPQTGFDDIIAFGDAGVTVAMGQDPATHSGQPFGQLYLAMPDFGANQGWSVQQTPRLVGDVNGDGIPDIVGFGTTSTFVAVGSRDAGGNLHFAIDPHLTIGDFGSAEGWSGSNPQTVRTLADVKSGGDSTHSDLVLSGAFNTQVWHFA